jgi:hypothetical protein
MAMYCHEIIAIPPYEIIAIPGTALARLSLLIAMMKSKYKHRNQIVTASYQKLNIS